MGIWNKAGKAGFLALGCVVLVEFLAVLYANAGRFVYTLDDAYIHMALADKIRAGHYGINSGEFCAPSSSILWPFLLAPFTFSGSAISIYVPLVLNLACAFGCVWLFRELLLKSIRPEDGRRRAAAVSILLSLFVVSANLAGIVFTGMEHSLQVLVCMAIVLGLIRLSETGKAGMGLAAAIVLAPLVRYEGLAVSVAALGYLALLGRFRFALATGTAMILPIAAFSLFLVHLGLAPMPASVAAKSDLVSSGGSLRTLLGNFNAGLINPRGVLIAAAMLACATFALVSGRKKEERLLALALACAMGMHLLVGRYGWYNRYEIYIWTVALMALIHFARGPLSAFVGGRRSATLAAVSGLWVLLICSPYALSLTTLPVASNNIFLQQFQMHRFAVEYYRRPMAVNDLGYVSYGNPDYVLDYYGLASPKALQARLSGAGTEWMDVLARENRVRGAMIYEDLFGKLPSTWKKVGDLRLHGLRITPYASVVAFYAMDDSSHAEMRARLEEFRKSLPPGASFEWASAPLPSAP